MVSKDPSVFARSLGSLSLLACLLCVGAVPAAEIKLPTLPPESLDNGVVPASIPAGLSESKAPTYKVRQAANAVPMAAEGVIVDGGPATVSASGSYFNPTLGQHIRARYNTRSYGQEEGNLNLGTMGLTPLGGGYGFFDGQVTLNEEQNVGFNLGMGMRWMTPPMLPNSPDTAKIMGVSIWADGQGVDADNFFPQVGVSYELLGDRIDFRANGYIPVGPSTRTRDFIVSGSDLTFSGNGIAAATVGVLDRALNVADAELAGRIGDLEAWLFGGVYAFDGGPYSEVGGKIGLRGYATHDLLLSIAVANDDLFDTNAIFSATWFIGRTRSNNLPRGTIEDRFREPVMRNDYVAIYSQAIAGSGSPLTDTSGDALNIVFVDSDAAAGGDGTFENPLNSIDDIAANSGENDIVLLTADSTFAGQMTTLQDGQQLLGEGGGFSHTVTTTQLGTITLPETFSGASSAAVPIVSGTAGTAVTLADGNTVRNVTFDGNTTAIGSSTTNGSVGATLDNLTINNSTGDAIALASVARVDVDDRDSDGNTTETFNTLGTITIDQVSFDSSVGNDIEIDATSTADETPGERLDISNITSTNIGGNPSLRLVGTTDAIGSAATISDYDYTGTGGSGGGMSFEMTGGVVSVSNSSFTGGNGPAISTNMNSGVIQVGSTNTITDIIGDAVVINANTDTGAVDVDADISTATGVNGGTVRITANEGNVGLDGSITANNVDAVVIDDARAQISFGQAGTSGTIQTTGATGNTVVITNAGANTTDPVTISFTGDVTNDAGGRVVSITGGDETTSFLGAVTETDGEGILIQDRANGAITSFTGETSLTAGTNDAVTLTNNDSNSSVNFNTAAAGSLVINTTSGNGIVGSGGAGPGELNVVDNTNTGATNSTITTDSGQAIALTGGSSLNGVNFDEVTVTDSGANSAVELTGFDGDVAINGGSLAADANVVEVNNAGLALDGVDVAAGVSGVAVNVNQSGSTSRAVSVRNGAMGGGDIMVASSSSANQTADLESLTGVGTTSFTIAGGSAGDLTATMDEVDSSGSTTVSTAGSGNASLTVTSGTTTSSFAGATVSTTSTGNASLNATDVTMSGALLASASSSGDVTANLTQVTGLTSASYTGTSGGTVNSNLNDVTMTGAITAAVNGSGSGTINATDVSGITGVDLDSNGSGSMTSTLTNVSGTGDITLDISSSGNGSLTLNNVNTNGQLEVESTGGASGNLTLQATNSGASGAFTGVVFNDQGDGAASATLTNVQTTNAGNLSYNSAGVGNATMTVTGGTYGTGIDADATSTGSFTATVINANLDSGNIDINGNNIGAVDFTFSNMTFATGADIDAIGVTLGANVSGGDVLVSNNTGVTTNNANAFSLTSSSAGASPINFQLSGNTFTNSSGTENTVLVDVAGTQTVNATITGNTATETTGGVAYVYDIATTAGNPTVNLNLASNSAALAAGGAGSGSIRVREAAGQVQVFELSDTFNNVGNRNNATVDFDPNNIGDFDDLANPPVTP